jgi:hypothetical protein
MNETNEAGFSKAVKCGENVSRYSAKLATDLRRLQETIREMERDEPTVPKQWYVMRLSAAEAVLRTAMEQFDHAFVALQKLYGRVRGGVDR